MEYQLQQAAASKGLWEKFQGQASHWLIFIKKTNLCSWILIGMNMCLSLWHFHQHSPHQPFHHVPVYFVFPYMPITWLAEVILVASWTQKMFCLGLTLCSGCLGPVEVDWIWEKRQGVRQTEGDSYRSGFKSFSFPPRMPLSAPSLPLTFSNLYQSLK